MSAKLYIHIGVHKTGSTMIQSNLLRCNSLLRRENIIYLPIRGLFKPLMFIDRKDVKLIDEIKKKLRVIVSAYKKNENTKFIISTEQLSGDPGFITDSWTSGYINSRLIAESLKEITNGFDVKIIVYLRRQDLLVESLYTQKIKEGGSESFNNFISNFSVKSFDWEYFLSHYSEYFNKENIFIRKYDKSYLPNKSSLIDDFSSIINSEYLIQNSESKLINKGYNRDALEIALLLNEHLSMEKRVELRALLQDSSTRGVHDKYNFFTFTQRNEFLKKYEDSNIKVSDKYFNKPEVNLFSYPIKDHYLDQYSGLKLESVIVIIFKVMMQQNNTSNTDDVKLYSKLKKYLNQSISVLSDNQKLYLKHWYYNIRS